jgi:phosphonopyruvate decarboxylase
MDCKDLWGIFQSHEVEFFTGVPDSTFKDWMVFLEKEHGNQLTNVIACNECEAIAIALGYHLATRKIGVVYMQNAGEGKTVNPLTSLCDPEVYSIPMLLMIGWRGQPDEVDEPQHAKMGKITHKLLDLMNIPHRNLSPDPKESKQIIHSLLEEAKAKQQPVAVIVPRSTIDDQNYSQKITTKYPLSRETAIENIMNNLSGTEVIISTTGKTSRELFEYRTTRKQTPHDFYTVGGMGCASSIALGVALQTPEKKIVVFDGDGALLMQMGTLATIGHYQPANLYHVLFDNEGHDSTGGQPTVSESSSFTQIAHAGGYRTVKEVNTQDELVEELTNMFTSEGPYFLSIKVNQGSRKDLGRPTTRPIENKQAFMKHIWS